MAIPWLQKSSEAQSSESQPKQEEAIFRGEEWKNVLFFTLSHPEEPLGSGKGPDILSTVALPVSGDTKRSTCSQLPKASPPLNQRKAPTEAPLNVRTSSAGSRGTIQPDQGPQMDKPGVAQRLEPSNTGWLLGQARQTTTFNVQHTSLEGSGLLNALFGSNVKERLSSLPGICVANCKPSKTGIKRCSRVCGSKYEREIQHRQALAYIERIATFQLPADARRICEELKILQTLMFCANSHRNSSPSGIIMMEAIKSKYSTTNSTDNNTENGGIATTRSPFPPTEDPRNRIQDFSPYRRSMLTKDDVVKNIRNILSKELSKSECKDGNLYVYWIEGNFGCRKIGWTTRPVEERFEEWEQKCKKKVNLVYPLEADKAKSIPHANRLEKLVHAELVNYRYFENCKGCGVRHMEWFQVYDDYIRAVIYKWSNWLMSYPYEAEEKEDSATWRLKAEHKENLAALCQPLEWRPPLASLPSKAIKPERKPQPPAVQFIIVRRSARLASKQSFFQRPVADRKRSSSSSTTTDPAKPKSRRETNMQPKGETEEEKGSESESETKNKTGEIKMKTAETAEESTDTVHEAEVKPKPEPGPRIKIEPGIEDVETNCDDPRPSRS
ncbi:MAG: hypothetical protein MMC33_003300 [Icmadophila ericetorum]|nr:hypothetical protein [Icmadophila ericetorum]